MSLNPEIGGMSEMADYKEFLRHFLPAMGRGAVLVQCAKSLGNPVCRRLARIASFSDVCFSEGFGFGMILL